MMVIKNKDFRRWKFWENQWSRWFLRLSDSR